MCSDINDPICVSGTLNGPNAKEWHLVMNQGIHELRLCLGFVEPPRYTKSWQVCDGIIAKV